MDHAVSASGRAETFVTRCKGIEPASASENESSGSIGFRTSQSRTTPSSPKEESWFRLNGLTARPYPARLDQVATVAEGDRRSYTRIHFPAVAAASRDEVPEPPFIDAGGGSRKASDVTKSEFPKVTSGVGSLFDVFAGEEARPRLD